MTQDAATNMRQVAPVPELLAKLVEQVKYKEGWVFELKDLDRGQGSQGLTLIISVTGPDSYHPETMFTVLHYMIVPAAAYDERSWMRWLLTQILQVEQHEACEFFRFEVEGSQEGYRPYAPNHGPGRDPYTIMDQGTTNDARTNFRGEKF